MNHQLFVLPRFEGPTLQELKDKDASKEIKEFFKKWTDLDSKDLIFVEHCEMTPKLIATLEECAMAEKSRSITLWIATEYFHDLERLCDNVATVSIGRLPNKQEKKVIFDKFGEWMKKAEMQAEMEKLKIPSYVATFCKYPK